MHTYIRTCVATYMHVHIHMHIHIVHTYRISGTFDSDFNFVV